MKLDREPALFFPKLARFYDFSVPFSWVVVRLGVGWVLAVHGYGKIARGMEAQTKQLNITVPYLADINYPLSFFLTFVEGLDRKSTRLNSSHSQQSRMPSSA